VDGLLRKKPKASPARQSPHLRPLHLALLFAFIPFATPHAHCAQPATFPPTPPGQLGYWNFDAPDWTGDGGRLPLALANAQLARSFDGRALDMTSTNPVRFVRYRLVEPTGQTNLNLHHGAIRFLHHPFWSSRQNLNPTFLRTDPTPPPPGHWVWLFAAGYYSGGQFVEHLALAVDPAGTNLVLLTHDPQGNVRTNLQVVPLWGAIGGGSPGLKPQTQWHEVVLNFSPNSCALILDGQYERDWLTRTWDGPGVPPLNIPDGATGCFTIGSNLAGTAGSPGLFDDLETFDRLATPIQVHSRHATPLRATITTNPCSVRLDWTSTGNLPHTVRRRLLGQTDWTLIARGLTNHHFLDTNSAIALDSTLEYSVDGKPVWVAVDQTPPQDRGAVILLIDDTLAAPLAPTLHRFQTDLAGDGWSVIRHDVPRHDDHAWDRNPINSEYRANVAHIKSLVRSDYNSDPARTRVILLIGHVTIPYSGNAAEDGHPDHAGAWPADNYYGDIDGDWTDSKVTTPPAVTNPAARNVPGDGKFDPTSFDQLNLPGVPPKFHGVEVAVGRIDFAHLPALAPLTEIDLLRRYFEKNHRYRHALLRFEPQVLVSGFFGNPFHQETQVLYDNALLLATRLFPPPISGLDDGNVFARKSNPLWALTGGYGAPDALHNNPDLNRGLGIQRVTTASFTNPDTEPGAGFYVLKGSYFGDWNLGDNNFLRAALAPRNGGLAAVWTRFTTWSFESAAAGEPLATALIATARGIVSLRTTSLLGDPTLTLFVTPPPANLTATRTANRVHLRWQAPSDPVDGYRIYRSPNPTGPFRPIDTTLQTNTFSTDPAPPDSRTFYQVRAWRRFTTGSGSFLSPSQAATTALK
jgi:hypothetical protein